MIEQEDAGFSAQPRLVCVDHTRDPALAAVIADLADADACDFCGREGHAIAADTDGVLDHISRSLFREYARAVEVLYIDEGDYVGPRWDIDELLDVHGAELDEPFGTFVCDAFADTVFAERQPYHPLPGEALRLSWQALAETVTHHSRFFFADENPSADEDDPTPTGAALLAEIGRLVERFGLVRELGDGELLWRIRLHSVKEGETVATATELGAPPERVASQSRMSPAGIPMLYAADELETAIAETPEPEHGESQMSTAGLWRPLRPCRIIDLTGLPPVPSIFETDEALLAIRQPLHFLTAFDWALRQPVHDPSRVHIDYVPSQLVCEWLRLRFAPGGAPIDGLAWESVKRPGSRNVVLWVRNEQCLEVGEEMPPWRKGALAVELVAVRRLQ